MILEKKIKKKTLEGSILKVTTDLKSISGIPKTLKINHSQVLCSSQCEYYIFVVFEWVCVSVYFCMLDFK